MQFVKNYKKTISLIFVLLFLVFGFTAWQKYTASTATATGSGLLYSGLKGNEEPFDFSQSRRSSGTYYASGDIGIGLDKKMRVRDNAIDSKDIENKSLKNEDLSTGAINSRTIKNGAIASKDLSADLENGFLKNTNGGLSWDKLNLSDISIPTIGNPIMNNLGAAFDLIWSSGIFSGGDITDNGNGSVNISSGEAMLRTSASATAPLKSLTFPEKANILMVNHATNYLWVSYNGGVPQIETSLVSTDFNCLEKCHLYTVVRDGLELSIMDGRAQNVDGNRKLRKKNYETDPFAHVTGGSVLGNIDRHLTLTPGAFYYSLQKINHYAFNTSLPGTDEDRVFEAYYRNGAGSWREFVDTKEIDNEHYDDGSGTPAAVSGGFYVVHWVYVIIGEVPRLATIYGRGYYATIEDAQKETAPTDLPASIKGAGFLVGRVMIAGTFNNIELVESAFSDNFTGAGGAGNGTNNHDALSGLSNDDHSQYALLAGRAGGQTLLGGLNANEGLIIQGTNASGNTPTNANLNFNVGDAGGLTAMSILNNGNVGIGDIDPVNTLDVTGSICAKETSDPNCTGALAGSVYANNFIARTGQTLPDYVFEPDYKLMALADLQTYIDTHKHLPGISSAAEVAKNGLNISEMVQGLLAKIEENTLYILNNNKEINKLKNILGVKNGSSDINIPGQLTADNIETQGVAVKNSAHGGDPTIGGGTIRAGDNSTTIDTKAVTDKSEIFVTIKSKINSEATLMVTGIEDGESFRVELANPLEEDVKFSWWIVDSN